MTPKDQERTGEADDSADRRPRIRLDDVAITEQRTDDSYDVRIEGINFRSVIVPPTVTVGGQPLEEVAVVPTGHRITGILPNEPEGRQVVVDYGFARDELTAAASDLVISDLQIEPEEDNGEPTDETITFENTGELPFDLSGFVVDLEPDQPQQNVPFPDVTLQPGETITLHIGTGTDSSSDFYAGYAQAKLNNLGDAIHVRSPTGETILVFEYLGGDTD